MINAITGVPGAGKGVLLTMRAEQELVATDRHIITNHALRVAPWKRRLARGRVRPAAGFSSHLLAKYGSDFGVWERVHLLSDEDFSEFFLWRINSAGELIKIDAERDKDNVVQSFNLEQFAVTRPVCYMMDEAWKFIWSRNWQKMGRGFLFYIAQHRHAGDDMWIAAQSESQIDKAVRELVQDWHSCVNHGKRKVFLFRQPKVISVVVSNEPPSKRKSVGAAPQIIRFKKSLLDSYDTSAGMGPAGQGADLEKKEKGLPPWLLPTAVVGLGVGIVLAARFAGWGTGKLLTHAPSVHPASSGPTNEPPKSGLGLFTVPSSSPAGSSTDVEPAPVYLHGWLRDGSVFKFFLSDGTVLRSSDPDFEKAGSPGLRYAGKLFPWEPVRRSVEPATGLGQAPLGSVPVMSSELSVPAASGESDVAMVGTARRPLRIVHEGLARNGEGVLVPVGSHLVRSGVVE